MSRAISQAITSSDGGGLISQSTAVEAVSVGDCSAGERTGASVAYVSVKDDLNAPALEAGDVLLVDLGVTRWGYDGVYVVDVNGEPIVRFVQDRARPYREEAAALADSLGLPKAQTAGDRVLGDVGEAVAGTGLTLGIGSGINALAAMVPRAAQAGVAPALRSTAPVAQNRLANFLTAQPGLQTASAITGSAAASGTKEAGGSQRNQLLAGLAGGFAPGALSGLASLATAGRISATGTVPTAAAGAARRAARGNDASGVQSMIDDFAASGTSPSVGQATGNRSASALETYLGNTPGGSGQIARRAADQAAAARNATDDLSNRIAAGGADLTPTQVGTNIQQGIYPTGRGAS